MFKAIIIRKSEGAGFSAQVESLDPSALPAGDVTVRVEYSTVNYKDALAMADRAPVGRKWPVVPGIDFAGTGTASASPSWQPGARVVLNGWGVGETHWGGLAQEARVDARWL